MMMVHVVHQRVEGKGKKRGEKKAGWGNREAPLMRRMRFEVCCINVALRIFAYQRQRVHTYRWALITYACIR